MANARKVISGLGFLATVLFVGHVHATSTFKITIDTFGLGLSDTIWNLAFDFSSINSLPNSATIFDFAITGGPADSGLIGSGTAAFPNVDGDLSTTGTVTLNDHSPIASCCAEYLHNAKLGDALVFSYTISGNADAVSDPDTLALFFLDASNLPFQTGDPSGALFVHSIGNEGQPAVYPPQECPDCVVAEQLPDVNGVPEPGVLALAMAGLLAFGAVRRVTKHPVRRQLTV